MYMYPVYFILLHVCMTCAHWLSVHFLIDHDDDNTTA